MRGDLVSELAGELRKNFNVLLDACERGRLTSGLVALAAVIAGALYPDELIVALYAGALVTFVVTSFIMAFTVNFRGVFLFFLRVVLFVEVLSIARRLIGGV